MSEQQSTRDSFQSRLGFILVSAGCAIGIGNVWKFPYLCGQFGGAAFILLYLLFLLILGIPVLRYDRTVGTRKESGSREWKARCKRGTSHSGKSGWQWEAVMRSEIK